VWAVNIETTQYELLEIPSKGGFGVVCIATDRKEHAFDIKVLYIDRQSQRAMLQRARDAD